MFKWRLIWDHFKQMNPYIAFGSILFLAGMVIGGTNPAFKVFLNEQLKGLGQLADMIDKSSNPTLTMIVIIFLNNAIKSILVIYLGALFGILPFLFLVVNGMLIGYLLKDERRAAWRRICDGAYCKRIAAARYLGNSGHYYSMRVWHAFWSARVKSGRLPYIR